MTTDIVIFTIRDGGLEILLIECGHPPFQGKWALPGGLVEEDEDLNVFAHRGVSRRRQESPASPSSSFTRLESLTATRAGTW